MRIVTLEEHITFQEMARQMPQDALGGFGQSERTRQLTIKLGDVTSFTLPGGYTIRFTGMKVKQQDGSQLQGIGIQPDILVKETIKGVTEGRDEFLEKALEQIK